MKFQMTCKRYEMKGERMVKFGGGDWQRLAIGFIKNDKCTNYSQGLKN